MTTTTRSAAKKQEEASGAPPAEHAEPGSKHKTDETAAPPSPKRSKKAKKKEKGSAKEAPPSDETKHEEQQPRDTHKTPQKPTDQDKDAPSSILEKGIIYFFHRARVDTDPHPSSLNDIARSYLLLRPLAPKSKDPDAGKPADGAASPTDKARLILVPKKTLPRTGRDRWTAVVEKAGASFAQLRDEFLGGSEYETKTRGTRHTPAATPVGEGVYAITSTGRASHLAYLLTLPSSSSSSSGSNGKEGGGEGGGGGVQLGEVQRKMGLRERGSFVVSTRNPEFGGPEGARVGKGAEYPEELLKEFRSLRWVPTQPRHLDYVGTQFLMVGESSGVEKALELQEEDVKEGKEEPEEEMERLEEEDAERLEGLGEDDAGRIYADLQVDAKEYPKLQTSF